MKWEKGSTWLGQNFNKQIKKPKNFKSPFQHGYYEGVESGLNNSNKSFKPHENVTGRKPISNLFKSKEYKEGFNKGRKEAVKAFQKNVIQPELERQGIRIIDLTRRNVGKLK